MAPSGSPDDLAWLASRIDASPLLPDPRLRRYWRIILAWLDADARYALAAARPRLDAPIAESRSLPSDAAPHVAVVLDADRTRPLPSRAATDPRVDNRYNLVPEDFPDVPSLHAADVRQVLDVRRRGTR